MPIDHSSYEIDVMISAKSIAAKVESLAKEITAFYAGTDKLVVVGLLRGSFVFIADLVRELNMPAEVDFLEVSSYGDSMTSSREVRIMKDLRGEIEGRDVLVVEDIIDTGLTINFIKEKLLELNPRSISIATLLMKPEIANIDFEIDWVGFEIAPEFVVGYGLDFNQKFRNLRGIYILGGNESE